MKQKSKQKINNRVKHGLGAGLFGLLFASSLAISPFMAAASIQDQINELQRQNAQNNQAVDRLEDQATSYQDAIAKLAAKINDLQGKINDNKRTQATLKRRIIAAQKELEEQKALLGHNIRAMYLEGEISTLEMLASSKDLSEFVDKQQYRTAVQEKIKVTLEKITELKHELARKKEAVDQLLKDQVAQQSELAAARNEQHSLLSYNKSQQAAYNRRTRSNQAKIADLIAQQQAANLSINGAGLYFLRFPGTPRDFNPGSYPYRNAGFSMQLGPCSNTDSWPDRPDRWGYCTRQCVSYAAWAVEASGREAPMYYGNAKNWVSRAIAHGVPVYRTPQPGDVAISTSGTWGHAMYVESVSGRSFTTSEYNTHLDGRLHYVTRTF